MTCLWWLIGSFAVYEAARTIATGEGPFSIFLKLRDRVGQNSWFGRGLNCGACLSFWGGLIAAALIWPNTWREFLLLWGGIAGGATLLWRVIG